MLLFCKSFSAALNLNSKLLVKELVNVGIFVVHLGWEISECVLWRGEGKGAHCQ